MVLWCGWGLLIEYTSVAGVFILRFEGTTTKLRAYLPLHTCYGVIV